MIWRNPPAETTDYPGLYVCDNRVTGSITDGRSRLPLWAYMADLAESGWDAVADNWPPHEMDAEKLGYFLHCLLEHRGEFGRLLCVLADVERREQSHTGIKGWWEYKTSRERVRKALTQCLAALDAQHGEKGA